MLVRVLKPAADQRLRLRDLNAEPLKLNGDMVHSFGWIAGPRDYAARGRRPVQASLCVDDVQSVFHFGDSGGPTVDHLGRI